MINTRELKPNEKWTEAERFFWLVGLLEGEGTFYTPSKATLPVVEIEMNDEDVVTRAASLIGSKVTFRDRAMPDVNGKQVVRRTYRTRLRGYRAVWLMHRIKPYMGSRRRLQIQAALRATILRPKKAQTINLYEPYPLGSADNFSGPRYEESETDR